MTEDPQQPEGEAPDEVTPEGAPGEPGEATPSETAPEPGEEAPATDDAPADAGEETPTDPEAPGPEIEGLEELDQAAEQAPEPAAEQEPDQAAEQAPAEQPERPARERRGRDGGGEQKEEVIPGEHLEPDLVLEEQRPEGEYGEYDQYADGDGAPGEEAEA